MALFLGLASNEVVGSDGNFLTFVWGSVGF